VAGALRTGASPTPARGHGLEQTPAHDEAKHGAAKRFGERRRVRGPRHEGLVGAE